MGHEGLSRSDLAWQDLQAIVVVFGFTTFLATPGLWRFCREE